MNNFYLVRHGEKFKTAGDPDLSSNGIRQAKLTAKYFQNKKISWIISSPFKRSLKTSQYIADVLNLKITVDDRLRERLNWGDKPNQTFEDFMKEWQQTVEDRNYKPSFGYSSTMAGSRLKAVLDEVSKNNKDTNIIFVAHGGIILDLLRNLFPDKHIKTFYSDFLKRDFSECSITHIEESDGKYKLKEVNSIGHLL